MSLSAAELYLQAWHGRHPDDTRLFATLQDSNGHSSYDRLAARLDGAESILDVACGSGALLARLAARAPRRYLAGIDFCVTEIQRARATVPSGRFSVARAQALPLAAASMDAVTCHLALMLMDEPTTALSEMHRVLRPGGALHIVVVNPTGFDSAIRRIMHALAHGGDQDVSARAPQIGDQRTFTLDGLHNLLANGFTNVAIEHVVVSRDVPRTELWEFIDRSVYGVDHLSAQAAHDRLEQLALPPQISWGVPLFYATGRASESC